VGRAGRSRVVLRAPRPADEAEFAALVRRSRVFLRGWAAPPAARQKFKAYVERSKRDDFRAYLVTRAGDGRIVGAFNVSQIFHGAYQCAFLGYWVGAEFARQGYMSEGLRLVMREVFGPLKLHRIEANVQPDNGPSKALLRRAGFRLEGFSPRYLKIAGRWRDHERWALTREEFRA